MDHRFITRETNGIRVHVLPTTKFKTTHLVLNFVSPLRAESVTLNALIPSVLLRGTRQYPSIKALHDRLDDLYGASLDSTLFKIGERQVVHFSLEIPNEKFLTQAPPLLEQGIDLLAQVLLDPLLDQGAFRPSFVELEKEGIRKRIESLFNNKGRFASLRCIETMCSDEDYRLYSYGRLEDLPGIDAKRLYQHYLQWLETAPMDMYVVGDVDPETVSSKILQAFAGLRRQVATIPPTPIKAKGAQVREVVDRFDVNQGQLVMGYRTGVTYTSADYAKFIVYNGVLGGYAHSKLFVNVREKASLAYSAYSRYESHKGLLMIQAGINIENHDRAIAIIQDQLEAMCRGEVTADELNQTKLMLANDFREMADSPGQMAHYAYVESVEAHPHPVPELLDAVSKVTVADLQAMAATLSLDTMYFLRDKETAEVPHA